MFRLWGKIINNNKIVKEHIFELNTSNLTLTLEEKIENGLEELCYKFDIERPMWFSDNNNDIDLIAKTTFKNQNFIETISFDHFEIEIIEDK